MIVALINPQTRVVEVRVVYDGDDNLPIGDWLYCDCGNDGPTVGDVWLGPTYLLHEVDGQTIRVELDAVNVPEAPPDVVSIAPLTIIQKLRVLDADKARTLLGSVDSLDLAEFYAAKRIRLDEPRLVAILASVGLEPANLLE